MARRTTYKAFACRPYQSATLPRPHCETMLALAGRRSTPQPGIPGACTVVCSIQAWRYTQCNTPPPHAPIIMLYVVGASHFRRRSWNDSFMPLESLTLLTTCRCALLVSCGHHSLGQKICCAPYHFTPYVLLSTTTDSESCCWPKPPKLATC